MSEGIVKFKITADIELVMTEEESAWYGEIGQEARDRAIKLTKIELENQIMDIVSPGMEDAKVTVTVEEVTE